MWRSGAGSVPHVPPGLSFDEKDEGAYSAKSNKPYPLLKQHTAIGLTTVPETTFPKEQSVSLNSLQMKFECGVCLEGYSESGSHAPRSLSCGHTFCTGCLSQLVKETISCPKCHQTSQLPPRGVNDLPKNYGVLEIMYSNPITFNQDNPSSSSVEDVKWSVGSSIPLCTKHGDQLSSFCEEDEELVCSSCLLYGPHKHHSSTLVNEAAIEARQTLVKLTPDISETIIVAEKSLKEIDTVVQSVKDSSHRISCEIDSHFDELVAVLENRKKELKLDALHRSQNRIEALLEQKEAISTRIDIAHEVHATCTHLLATPDNYILLGEYKKATDGIQTIFVNLPSMSSVARDDLVIDFPKEAAEELQSQYYSHGNIRSGVGTVKYVVCEPFHDGVRIYWQGHNYVDSIGITYALQMSRGDNEEFVNIYRGGDTKYTWKCDSEKEEFLKHNFRVRVQTCEGVGNWCTPVSCIRSHPGWKWHKKWCNIKVEIGLSQMEAWSRHASGKDWTLLAGDTILSKGQHYVEIEVKETAKHHIRRVWSTKLAIGLIQCKDRETANSSIAWQECKYPVGQLPSHNSWSFLATGNSKMWSRNSEMTTEEYGGIASIESGDKLGMLVDFDGSGSACVSFFCGSLDLGVAFTRIPGPFLPVVSVCDRFHICLKFPPPPYSKRNPRLTLLSSGSSTALF